MASSPFGRLVGGVVSSLVGIGVLVFGVWVHHRTAAAESWPTVPGIVDSSSVSTSHSRRGGTKYSCQVRYHFSVAGADYTGDDLTPTGSSSESSTSAYAHQMRYKPGAPCTVHFDTSDPATNCLELGSTSDGWIWMGLGVVLALVGGGTSLRSVFRV